MKLKVEFIEFLLLVFRTNTPIQRQISQTTQQQSSQQKFYVTKANSPATPSNIVKIQQNHKIFIQSPKTVYVTNPTSGSNPQIDDLSHLE